MSKLADTYQRRDGLIDYRSCFRNTLSDLANQLPVFDEESVFKPAQKTIPKKAGPVHPWDFNYVKQEIVFLNDPTIPHWQSACLKPKTRPSTASQVDTFRPILLSPVKSPKNADELLKAISKYDDKVKSVCSKLVKQWQPHWRQLLANLHDSQIKNHPGNVTMDNFTAILDKLAIKMTKYDYGVIYKNFKTPSLSDVFNFTAFIEVCNICRSLDRITAISGNSSP